jgi:perosamine synthetase
VYLSRHSLETLLQSLLNGKFRNKNYLREFEDSFARYIGVKYAFGVSSGRAALCMILDVLNFKRGTEIIVSDYNFPLIPLILKQYRLKPIFVDIHPKTHNLDVSLIEEKITPRSGAILVTHLFGQPCEMDAILQIASQKKLTIIEDCAHSCGSEYRGKKVGSFGDLGYFSFGPGKNLPCLGGGMLVTNDELIMQKLKGLYEKFPPLPFLKLCKSIMGTVLFYLATHKNVFPYILYPVIYFLSLFNLNLIDNLLEERIDRHSLSVYKYKMSNLQAMVGLSQLESLDEINKRRINNACILNEKLKSMDKIRITETIPEAKNIYLYYRILTEDRESFRKRLLKKGIDTKIDDMRTSSLLPIFNTDRQECPISQEISSKGLEIPCSPFMNKEDILYIIEQIKELCEE